MTWFWARSLRYSVLVRVAIAMNFSHLWAAFSALITANVEKKSNYVRHLISQFVILTCLLELFGFFVKQGEITAYFWQEEILQTGLILETWHSLGYGDQMEGHLLILWQQYCREPHFIIENCLSDSVLVIYQDFLKISNVKHILELHL